MDIRFDGKKALVTGAGKGIGKIVALKLAECGADVLAVSRTQSDLDELAEMHERIQTICLDVGDWDATEAALKEIGPIDLLVNNAGVLIPCELENMAEKDIDYTYNINVKAILNITRIVAEGMKVKGEGGAIVNLSSIGGLRGRAESTIYCSSKGAVDQITRCLAAELAPYKIRVNSVNPTVIRTNMVASITEPENEFGKHIIENTPLKRFGEVEEVAYPILFLLSDKASLITAATLPIDGGLTSVF